MEPENPTQPPSGFTLIELSIVLVIIGLLAAGILVGRDMIRAAEIRGQISQLEKMNTAVDAFRLKYNCLPGDCASAADYGLGNAGEDGDGNGVIEFVQNGTSIYTEQAFFWQHLSHANLIPDSQPVGHTAGVNSPPLKFKGSSSSGEGGLWIYNSVHYIGGASPSFGPAWMLSTGTRQIIPSNLGGVYLAFDTYNIDAKIDNGLPMSGNMLSMISWPMQCHWVAGQYEYCDAIAAFTTSGTVGSAEPASCIDDIPPVPVYNIVGQQNNPLDANYSYCIPIIKTQF